MAGIKQVWHLLLPQVSNQKVNMTAETHKQACEHLKVASHLYCCTYCTLRYHTRTNTSEVTRKETTFPLNSLAQIP